MESTEDASPPAVEQTASPGSSPTDENVSQDLLIPPAPKESTEDASPPSVDPGSHPTDENVSQDLLIPPASPKESTEDALPPAVEQTASPGRSLTDENVSLDLLIPPASPKESTEDALPPAVEQTASPGRSLTDDNVSLDLPPASESADVTSLFDVEQISSSPETSLGSPPSPAAVSEEKVSPDLPSSTASIDEACPLDMEVDEIWVVRSSRESSPCSPRSVKSIASLDPPSASALDLESADDGSRPEVDGLVTSGRGTSSDEKVSSDLKSVECSTSTSFAETSKMSDSELPRSHQKDQGKRQLRSGSKTSKKSTSADSVSTSSKVVASLPGSAGVAKYASSAKTVDAVKTFLIRSNKKRATSASPSRTAAIPSVLSRPTPTGLIAVPIMRGAPPTPTNISSGMLGPTTMMVMNPTSLKTPGNAAVRISTVTKTGLLTMPVPIQASKVMPFMPSSSLPLMAVPVSGPILSSSQVSKPTIDNKRMCDSQKEKTVGQNADTPTDIAPKLLYVPPDQTKPSSNPIYPDRRSRSCRFCARIYHRHMTSLFFSPKRRMMASQEKIDTLYRNCVYIGLPVDDVEGISPWVCESCSIKVKNAATFIQKARKTYYETKKNAAPKARLRQNLLAKVSSANLPAANSGNIPSPLKVINVQSAVPVLKEEPPKKRTRKGDVDAQESAHDDHPYSAMTSSPSKKNLPGQSRVSATSVSLSPSSMRLKIPTIYASPAGSPLIQSSATPLVQNLYKAIAPSVADSDASLSHKPLRVIAPKGTDPLSASTSGSTPTPSKGSASAGTDGASKDVQSEQMLRKSAASFNVGKRDLRQWSLKRLPWSLTFQEKRKIVSSMDIGDPYDLVCTLVEVNGMKPVLQDLVCESVCNEVRNAQYNAKSKEKNIGSVLKHHNNEPPNFASMKDFDWTPLYEEFKTKCPLLFVVLTAAMHGNNEVQDASIPVLCTIYAMIMYRKNRYLNRFQKTIGYLLGRDGASKRLVGDMNYMGLSSSYTVGLLSNLKSTVEVDDLPADGTETVDLRSVVLKEMREMDMKKKRLQRIRIKQMMGEMPYNPGSKMFEKKATIQKRQQRQKQKERLRIAKEEAAGSGSSQLEPAEIELSGMEYDEADMEAADIWADMTYKEGEGETTKEKRNRKNEWHKVAKLPSFTGTVTIKMKDDDDD